MNKNHHGYVVTSPTGSVSLTDLPVPVHESSEKAAKWARAQGKKFKIVPASEFFRTSFGKMVQSLTHKRLSTKPVPIPEKVKVSPVAKWLANLKQKKQDIALERKILEDTKKRYPTQEQKAALDVAKQMRITGEALDQTRGRLADHSYLNNAMRPKIEDRITIVSDDDLASLYSRQTSEERGHIDRATRFHWTKARINKLVKANSIRNILILFRAGQLPEKARTYKKLLEIVNLKCRATSV